MIHEYASAVARFGSDKALDKTGEVESVCCLTFGESAGTTPILTIGIPVFNGGQSICRTLTSIYNGLKLLTDTAMVEIVICDNASTDRTSEEIHDFFSGKAVHGSYFRHQVNLGFDANLDSIVKFGKGEYIWFVGCGDEVKADGVARLVEKLGQMKADNLLLDFDRFSEADSTLIQKREHSNRSDMTIKVRDDFSHPRYAPALSANVIKREKWAQCLNEGFVTSGWGHVERILGIISLNEKSETAILAEPFFTLFVDKNGWWTKPDGYKLHLEHIKVIRKMDHLGFKPYATKKRLQELNGVVLVRSVVGAKKYGYKFNEEDMREIRVCCRLGIYPLVVLGLHLPLRLASFIFSESKRKALRLGFRKIYKRIFGDN